jgi:hypothetical protein
VPSTASTDELRRAYRRRLRETHPDTGGTAAEFQRVQAAWDRIGTPEARAAYHPAGYTTTPYTPSAYGAQPGSPSPRRSAAGSADFGRFGRPSPRTTAAPPDRARAYGYPGGWWREQYLDAIGPWSSGTRATTDAYDPDFVAGLPRVIRNLLSAAVAEEATARMLPALGSAYTVWHDVLTDATAGAARKIDHIVLGPTGLFAVLSEHWASPLSLQRDEIVGAGLRRGEKPIRSLARRARAFASAKGVVFTALVIVVPDGAAQQPLVVPPRGRRPVTWVVSRSEFAHLLRTGLPGAGVASADDVFTVRSRLQREIRFV